MTNEQENLELIRRYFAAIENGTTGELMEEFFTSDFRQFEFPNRLMPNGAERDLAQVKAAGERGRQTMVGQRYEILTTVANGNMVAVETMWTGTLKIPFGNLRPGDQMRARFAVFLEFRDGRIAVQRNYDCFDPW